MATEHVSESIRALMRHIRPDPEKVVDAVSAIFGTTRLVLLSKDRCKTVCCARMGCTLVLRRHGFSYPEIGRALKRDHTTAMSGLARAELLETTDEQFRSQVQLVEEIIRPKYLKVRIESETEKTEEETARGLRIVQQQR